jgi:hypothetical protein
MDRTAAPRLVDRLKERSKDPQLATEGADIIAPTIYPPATAAMIEAAEQTLGFGLPPLLRQIYLEVGNGGFGPGYGLIGVPGGAVDSTGDSIVDRRGSDSTGDSIVEMYQWFRRPERDDSTWKWPAQLLPVCHLGCAMYACVDCSDPDGAVTWWEPNPRERGDPVDLYLIPVGRSLEGWLWAWLRNEDWMSGAYGASPLLRWLEERHAQHE